MESRQDAETLSLTDQMQYSTCFDRITIASSKETRKHVLRSQLE